MKRDQQIWNEWLKNRTSCFVWKCLSFFRSQFGFHNFFREDVGRGQKYHQHALNDRERIPALGWKCKYGQHPDQGSCDIHLRLKGIKLTKLIDSVKLKLKFLTRINDESICVRFFWCESRVVQVIVIVMRTQKRVKSFHFITNWNWNELAISFCKLFWK